MNIINEIRIKSSVGSGILRIGPRQGDYLDLEFHGQSLRAVSKIYLYQDNSSLLKLFEDLYQNWNEWEGQKSWRSLEGDFSLSFSTDKLGHVSMSVEMINRSVEPNWTISTHLLMDPGSLETLLNQARILLA